MRLASIAFRENVTAAPVLIIACLVAPTSPTTDVNSLFAGSSIYAAVQNLMLAARAGGSRHRAHDFQHPHRGRDPHRVQPAGRRKAGGGDSAGLPGWRALRADYAQAGGQRHVLGQLGRHPGLLSV